MYKKYYKEDKLEGEGKVWYNNGQLEVQYFFKEGKKEGEGKQWNRDGSLTEHKIYENDNIVKDLLNLETSN